ncbi:MAG TPA: 3-hydroxyacyl-CoA dehydrogenase NAD-binding domain-containing protein [Gemmatimonadales bacterium]|jgi:3-hydroxybutyryl-CoA dehydrogenase
MSMVAVIGAGTMGNGIAHTFAQHGWDVALVDLSQDALDRAIKTIATNIEKLVRKGVGSRESGAGTLARIKPSTSFDAVKGAEILVEAVTENPTIKFEIFATVSRLLAPDSILASNTSSISITEIAKHTDRPGKVIGMHFMNPVPVMKLVEVIRGQETSSDTVKQTVEIVRDLGKTPVEVNDAPGFVSNRVLMPMINEAIFCVQDGIATAEGVDQVMTLGMNHPLGPLALADLIGLDVCLAIMKVLQDGLDQQKYRPAPLLEQMVTAGKLGRKSGHGFYAYRD